MWQGEILGKWASIVTILSLVGVPIAYFVKQNKRENEREMEKGTGKEDDGRNHGKGKEDDKSARKGAHVKKSVRRTIRYFVRHKRRHIPKSCLMWNSTAKPLHLQTDFLTTTYTTAFFSGGIKFLDSELHQKTRDIFNMIKNHNHYLRLTIENRGRDGKISRATMQYYVLLDKYERRLLDEIPLMMTHLEEKFGFKSPS